MHPIYYAFMVLAGGLTAYFAFKETNTNTNSSNRVPQKQREIFDYYERPGPRRQQTSDDYQECPVCLHDVRIGRSEYLTCTHRMHVKCMDDYLLNSGRNAVCPICRNGRRLQ